VLGSFGKRAAEVTVLFFAAYAFAFVPLGKRTAFEHVKAILDTRAAHEAGTELSEAADRLRHRLVDGERAPPVPRQASPRVPELPRRSAPHGVPNLLTDQPDASL
jgi:hypothetical protein